MPINLLWVAVDQWFFKNKLTTRTAYIRGRRVMFTPNGQLKFCLPLMNETLEYKIKTRPSSYP